MKISQEWLTEELNHLDRLANSKERERLQMQFEALGGHLSILGKLEEVGDEDFSDLIIQSEVLMLASGEAEWITINGDRFLKVSPRLTEWGLNILFRKSETVALRVIKAFHHISEWEHWKRITIEFDRAEFDALVKVLSTESISKEKCKL